MLPAGIKALVLSVPFIGRTLNHEMQRVRR